MAGKYGPSSFVGPLVDGFDLAARGVDADPGIIERWQAGEAHFVYSADGVRLLLQKSSMATWARPEAATRLDDSVRPPPV